MAEIVRNSSNIHEILRSNQYRFGDPETVT